MTRSNRRTNQSGRDFVTPRPQVGRAYTSHHDSVTSQADSSTPSREPWCCCNIRCIQNCLMCRRDEENLGIPGGRDLWIRMISWLMVVEILGCVCLFLGSTFLTNSFINDDDDDKTAAAISACLLVAGAILMGGGIILGRLFISNKWRKTSERSERRDTELSHVERDNHASNPSYISTHPRSATSSETSFTGPLPSLPSYEQVLASHPADFIITPSMTTSHVTGDSTPAPNSHEVDRDLRLFEVGGEEPPPYTIQLQGGEGYEPQPPQHDHVELEPPPPYHVT